MDEYDNISHMPNQREQAPPRINLAALSLINEDGHLTITFWLLAAAIVVAIYLVIEMLEPEGEIKAPASPVAPVPGQQNNHTPATRKPRTPVAKEASQDA